MSLRFSASGIRNSRLCRAEKSSRICRRVLVALLIIFSDAVVSLYVLNEAASPSFSHMCIFEF